MGPEISWTREDYITGRRVRREGGEGRGRRGKGEGKEEAEARREV